MTSDGFNLQFAVVLRIETASDALHLRLEPVLVAATPTVQELFAHAVSLVVVPLDHVLIVARTTVVDLAAVLCLEDARRHWWQLGCGRARLTRLHALDITFVHGEEVVPIATTPGEVEPVTLTIFHIVVPSLLVVGVVHTLATFFLLEARIFEWFIVTGLVQTTLFARVAIIEPVGIALAPTVVEAFASLVQ